MGDPEDAAADEGGDAEAVAPTSEREAVAAGEDDLFGGDEEDGPEDGSEDASEDRSADQ